MARNVKVRDSYTNDCIDLRRLRDAVAKDVKRPKEWRQQTLKLLDDSIKMLLQAPNKAA